MTLVQCLQAAIDAAALLGAHPFHWLAVVLTFLVAVEALMLIPRVGFVLKIGVAGIATAGVMSLFAGAAAGTPPSALGWLAAFTRPVGQQAVLALAGLLPFAVGLAYLRGALGPEGTRFFFGRIGRDAPPPKPAFLRFKFVMQAASLPLTWITGAVVLKGLSGLSALSAALGALVPHALALGLVGVMAMAFEALAAQPPAWLPKPVALAGSLVAVVLFLGWSFALLYTLSARVFVGA